MEPLQDLYRLMDWESYTPDLDDYAEPHIVPEHLDPDLAVMFDCLGRLEEKGRLMGPTMLSDAPTPGLMIHNRPIPTPMQPSEFRAIIKSGKVSCHTANLYEAARMERIRTANPAWNLALDKGIKSSFSQMKMFKREIKYTYTLANLGITKPGPHHIDLNLERVSPTHFATVVVVVPSERTHATLEAHHGGLTASHDLTEGAPFATHFVAFYTDTSDARLFTTGEPLCYLTYHVYGTSSVSLLPSLGNIVGPCPEVALGFAEWRYALNSGSAKYDIPPGHILYQLETDDQRDQNKSVDLITTEGDKLILAHLAPAARHYGFEILLAHVEMHYEVTWDVLRGYEEYDEEYDEDDYSLENYDDLEPDEVIWHLRDLDGSEIKDDRLKAQIEEGQREDCWIFNHVFDDQNFEDEEFQVVDQSKYEDTLQLTGNKYASFFVIGPTPV